MSAKSISLGRRQFFARAMTLAAASALPASAATPTPPTSSPTEGLPQRTLGRGQAALTVSAIGFGCMGLNCHRGAFPPKAQAIALIHEAIARGVTFLDTAEGYGPFTNEELVGEALRGHAEGIVVATKFGHKYRNGVRVMDEEDSSPANIRAVCDASLRRLGIPAIGLFYQHRVDPKTPIETVAETVAELIRAGKVRTWGLCEANAETIRRAHAVCPLAAVQSEWHLMHRAVETNGVLATCRELGIGFVPYSPINRGFLGGLINEHTRFTGSDNRGALPRFQPEAIRANLRIVEALNRFGRTRGLTPAQLALGWLLHQNDSVVPIPGTTKRAHLWENLDLANLPDADWTALTEEVAAIPVVGSRYDAANEAKVQS